MEKFLLNFINNNEVITYFIIFFSVFAETGFVITPFFPGDSIVVMAGILATNNVVNKEIVFLGILISTFLGNFLNFTIGYFVGNKLKLKENGLLSKENIDKAHKFYENNGGVTIVFSRFMPLFRTLVPFVAGISKLSKKKFLIWNLLASILWSTLFFFAGYFLGEVPIIKNNLNIFIILVALFAIVISIITFIIKKILKIGVKNEKK